MVKFLEFQHFIFHYFKGGIREALVLELARWHGQRIHLLIHDVERLDQSTPPNWLKDRLDRFLRSRILGRGCHHAYTFSQAAAALGELRLEPLAGMAEAHS